MPQIELGPEVEERIREIVRDEIRKVEAAQRPPWSFDRMDAALSRTETRYKADPATVESSESSTAADGDPQDKVD